MAEQLYDRMPRERLYEHIASYVEDLIVAGKLKPGDQLPPERELAQRMQVGRGVVRESVKLLGERGLVEVLPGRGTFVAEPDTNTLAAQLDRFFKTGSASYRDLREVRKVLEVAIAGLAAQRATPEELERLERAIAEMDESLESPDEFVEAHLSFHRCLAEAAGNSIFPILVDALVDLLRERTREILGVPGAPESRQFWHRRIFEAVAHRDAAAARDAMEQHLAQGLEDAEERDLKPNAIGQRCCLDALVA
jgi:GntR family transcriptional repressor for pyruvate dehydrogenase complex